MAPGTRKGFKYVAGAKPIVTETITFDEVEKEGTTTPGASRKRGATRAAEAKAAKFRKVGTATKVSLPSRSTKSSVSASASASNGGCSPSARASMAGENGDGGARSKAHYPIIEMSISKISGILKKNKGSFKSHAEVLDRVVVEVCALELEGLDAFFAANPAKGREAIRDVIATVLDQIPTSVVSTCEEGAEFLPEFVPGEKNEVAVLSDVITGLQEHRKRLEAYSTDMGKLAEDYDIWLSGPPESITQAYRDGHAEEEAASEVITKVSAAADSFEDVLHEIQDSCKNVLVSTNQAKETETMAQKVHEKLYGNFNRFRLEAGPSGVSLPQASTKDLMKGFTAKM